MIDKATVDRIFAAADIVEVVSDFVTLRRKGVNYGACCPFHSEKTPSFVVSPAKGLFKCFGCGKGGNAVTFVMEHEGMTYVEALKYVGKKYGIAVEERILTDEEARRNDDRESMMVANSWASEWFSEQLWGTDEGLSVGVGYFRGRGFSDEMIRRFSLGYCPRGDRMTQAALKAGYKEQFLTGVGLSIKRESGGWFDRFSERVMFPIHSMSGRVVAFGGRTLRTDKNVAKYQNSPESEVYSKKNTLYGIFFAKKAISQQRNAILVEGYTDVISMHQSGVENVVASSGTSLTTEQVRLLKRFTENVTVIYDGDAAGIKASLRGIDMILREGLSVRVVLLPDGEDPDSFARGRSAAELQEFIRANEEDFLSFKARLLMREARGDSRGDARDDSRGAGDDSRNARADSHAGSRGEARDDSRNARDDSRGDGRVDVIRRAEAVTEMVASIAEIPDAIRRAMYVAECAATMDVDAALLTSEVARKRLTTTSSDAEASEFIRRQSALRREQVAELAGSGAGAGSQPLQKSAMRPVGSSIDELEKELVRYLIKYGSETFDFREGRTSTTLGVAPTIIGELRANGFTLRGPAYRALYDTYVALFDAANTAASAPSASESAAGSAADASSAAGSAADASSAAGSADGSAAAVPDFAPHHFINHPDPAAACAAVDMLTEDENYVPSKLWKRHEMSVAGELERLGETLPRTILLYKSKVIELLSGELRARLAADSDPDNALSEAETLDILRRLDLLNKEKTAISRRLSRLIL